MTTVTQTFLNRWRTPDQLVGNARPNMYVEVRKGRFYRSFGSWTFPEGVFYKTSYAKIPSSPSNNSGRPWSATWTPQGSWMPLRGISQVTLQKDIGANNGVGTANITVENTRMQQFPSPVNPSLNSGYHLWDRGYLTPWRGAANTTFVANQFTNEWFNVMIRNAQIRVWQGYTSDITEVDPVSGKLIMVPTFVGLIDDVEFDSGPNGDQAILTCRDFGRVLTDENLYLWSIDPTLHDPIVFVDAGWAASHPAATEPGVVGTRWIQVDDLADIVRLVLMWAGFKHWLVEDTKQGLNPGQPLSFNRSNYLIDVINEICRLTGFAFFIGDPDPNDPESLGIPVFRYPQNLIDLDTVTLVHDKQLLTQLQASVIDEDRAYIIRARGKIPNLYTAQGYPPSVSNLSAIDRQRIKNENIITDSGDPTLRPEYTYRPPWTVKDQEAGILKHVTHTDDYYVTIGDCATACFLIAASEAIASYTATGSCPGNPAIGLDEHVSVFDRGTGIDTRIWVSSVKSSFVQGVDQEQQGSLIWSTTFSGALLDTPDMVAIKQELASSNINGIPNPDGSGAFLKGNGGGFLPVYSPNTGG